MKKVYSDLQSKGNLNSSAQYRKLKKYGLPLSSMYLAGAQLRGLPGAFIHRKIVKIAERLASTNRLRKDVTDMLKISPLDTCRYFEFDYFYKRAKEMDKRLKVMDISSPRMLPIIFLTEFFDHMVCINPDIKDLLQTAKFLSLLEILPRCEIYDYDIEHLPFPEESFDLITSMSVVEHIPEDGDHHSIQKIWRLLKKNGRLLLSVPCAKEGYEEYINFNEYGLLQPDKEGFVFGQRFYDDYWLKEKIFSVTGQPVHFEIYGERQKNFFVDNRQRKMNDPAYPSWKESLITAKGYKFYEHLSQLPGTGVIAMEFVKY